MQRKRYSVVYYFDNPEMSVLEIKRNLLSETDKTKLYFWFCYDKENDSLEKLEFVSASEQANMQHREFEGGATLKFETKGAVFILDGKSVRLKPIAPDKVFSEKLSEAVEDYFTALSFR